MLGDIYAMDKTPVIGYGFNLYTVEQFGKGTITLKSTGHDLVPEDVYVTFKHQMCHGISHSKSNMQYCMMNGY